MRRIFSKYRATCLLTLTDPPHQSSLLYCTNPRPGLPDDLAVPVTDLGKQDPDDALSRSEEEEGSRADEVLEKDDGKASSSSGTGTPRFRHRQGIACCFFEIEWPSVLALPFHGGVKLAAAAGLVCPRPPYSKRPAPLHAKPAPKIR